VPIAIFPVLATHQPVGVLAVKAYAAADDAMCPHVAHGLACAGALVFVFVAPGIGDVDTIEAAVLGLLADRGGCQNPEGL
jgi:hypothetical protein